MLSNLPLILTLLTLITGVLWLLEQSYLGPQRRKAAALAPEPAQPAWLSYTAGLFPVLAVVFVFRSFLYEPFNIPSLSMSPTLLVGDFILVNKFTYGIRLPVIDQKIVAVSDPQRGDVMVFKHPDHPSEDLIKRVVGVPGDHIVYRDKRLTINGQPLSYQAMPDYTGEDYGARTEQFVETLGGVEHKILQIDNRPAYVAEPANFAGRELCSYDADGFACTVPAGRYFMMGDSRDNSNDSRFWGFVPDKNIIGKAFVVWMNFHQLKHIGAIH